MTFATPPITGSVPAELLTSAHAAAARLGESGVGEGDRIAIDSPLPLPWLLGADLLGAASLVIDPSWPAEHRRGVLEDAGARAVVGADLDPREPHVERQAGTGSTVFYLPTTSGSSGRPKVLARTRDSWLRSFATLGPIGGTVLIPGPLSSSLFLFGALHTLWSGGSPLLRPRWHPAEAREAHAVHLVPPMLAGLLTELERQDGPCALRTVVCGGAEVAPHLRERFHTLLPDAELIEYYGSAEHSLIAIRRSGGKLLRVPDVELDVREGVLWVRSPLAFSGYLREGVLEPAGAWTTVGDLADVAASGEVTVHGRGSSTITSGGNLVPAEEVERVLRTVAGVTDVVVSGTPHPRLGAIVTAVVEGAPSLRELRQAARAALPPAKRPRRWLVTATLPRTASGKPARSAIAERLRDATLTAEPLV
ncbi:AMP-binding protein [Saccharomonospora sp. NPDC006951]